MSINAMLNAATLPVGDPASLFKNPASGGIAELAAMQGSLGDLMTALGVPTTGLSGIGDLCDSVNSHMSSKIASLPSQLPMMAAAANVQQRTAQLDAALSNSVPPPPVSGGECPDLINDAFKTLKDTGGLLEEVGNSVVDTFSGIDMQPIFDVVNGISGGAVSSVKDLLSAIGGPGGGVILAAIEGAPVPGGLVDSIASAVGDIATAVTAKSGEFVNMVANEAAAVTKGMGDLVNFHFLGSLSSPSACVKSVQDAVINPSAVNPAAVAAISSNSPTISDIAKNAASKRQAVENTPDSASVPATITIPAPASIANLPLDEFYTTSEMNAFTDVWEQARKEAFAADDEAAKFMEDIIQWKIEVSYEKAKSDAGYTKGIPDGTTTNIYLQQLWIGLRNVQRAKIDEFNNHYIRISTEKFAKSNGMRREWFHRYKYGRHYATNMTSIIGATWAPGEITTLLDTTS